MARAATKATGTGPHSVRNTPAFMKSLTRMFARWGLPGLAVAIAFLVTGCMNRYEITLSSGNIITTKGKPKYDKATDTFRYTDLKGAKRYVPSVTVREVAPYERKGKETRGVTPGGMPAVR
jgi:hypothetical protein